MPNGMKNKWVQVPITITFQTHWANVKHSGGEVAQRLGCWFTDHKVKGLSSRNGELLFNKALEPLCSMGEGDKGWKWHMSKK